jgi:hypothetical protein
MTDAANVLAFEQDQKIAKLIDKQIERETIAASRPGWRGSYKKR